MRKTTTFAFVIVILVLFTSSAMLACSSQTPPSPQLPPSSPVPVPATIPVPPSPSQTNSSKIQFLAHATFLITYGSGLKILTDPYEVYSSLKYAPLNVSADIVTVSHDHQDHNNAAAIGGQPEIVKTTGTNTVKGIPIKSIATWHDNVQGTRSGPNIVFCFTVDGIRFCHLGDLGHKLSTEQLAAVGSTYVLFMPVSGGPTIDAKTATEVGSDLKARIIIPMHYKTPKVGFALAGVDDFLAGKENVKKVVGNIFELKVTELPSSPLIVVLESAN